MENVDEIVNVDHPVSDTIIMKKKVEPGVLSLFSSNTLTLCHLVFSYQLILTPVV